MAFLSKYGVARHIYIPMVKRAVVDHAVGADWTPAAGDVKISKDGGATANVTNLPTAIAMGNSALWDFSLTATEMEAAQVMVTIADSATKAVEDSGFILETYGHASGQHAVDLDDGVRAGLTALPNAAAEAAGGLFTRGTGAGQINQAANGMIDTNPVRLNNVSQSLLDLKDFADDGYDPSTNKVQGVVLVDTVTTITGVSAATVAAAVWDEDATGHQTVGTFGKAIGDPGASSSTIWGDINSKLDIAVSSRSSQASQDIIHTNVTQIETSTDAILIDTAEIGAAGAGLTAINLPNQTMDIVGNITGNLSGSVGSVTGAVGSVTGNVGGNVTGSVGSVTGLTNATIADAVWDEAIAGHLSAGSTGEALANAGAAGTPPTVGDIADAVWDEALAGHLGAGSTGEALDNAGAGGTPPTVGEIADEVETRTMAAVTVVNGLAANTVTAAALSTDAANEIADALLDRANAIETGITPRGAMRIGVAADAGKTDGMASAGTAHLRDVADTKDRVTATTDGAGNRTATAVDTS